MTFYIAQHDDGDYDRDSKQNYYFKSKEKAEAFIEKNAQALKNDNHARWQWERQVYEFGKYELAYVKKNAEDEQFLIEAYAEQLKKLDPLDQQKIDLIKNKIKNKEYFRDASLSRIREMSDYEFWLENRINEERSQWSILEVEFMDEPVW